MVDAAPSGASPSLSPAGVDALLAGVGGWLGPLEGRLLYGLAAEADPAGAIVEIGSWHGRSTTWLAAGARAGRGARVVAIDPHRGTSLRDEGEDSEPILRANLERAGLGDGVRIVVATSSAAAAGWTEPISLLWIDGDHAEEAVRLDLELWTRHLLPGAAVALHDTFVFPGPERAVRDLLVRSRRYTGFAWAETTTAARLCERLSPPARLHRRLTLARRSLYGIRLRAYDSNRFGFARAYDVLAGRRR